MTPDLAIQYHSVFAKLRVLNIISEVTFSASNVLHVFYFPHHPVIRESSLRGFALSLMHLLRDLMKLPWMIFLKLDLTLFRIWLLFLLDLDFGV